MGVAPSTFQALYLLVFALGFCIMVFDWTAICRVTMSVIIMFLNVLLFIQSRNRWDTVDGTCLSIGPDRTFSIYLRWLKIGPLIGLVVSQPRSLTVDSWKGYLFPQKKKREQLKLVLVTSFVHRQSHCWSFSIFCWQLQGFQNVELLDKTSFHLGGGFIFFLLPV